MEAPSEGSSLTDEDNDSVHRDQIDKEIRTLCAQMLAASTATPGSSTHVNPDESHSSGGETDPTRLPISQHEHCATTARPDLETSDGPFPSPSPSEQQSPNSALRGPKCRREQGSFDWRDLPSTSGLTSGPSHAISTSSLPTPSPDRMETTSGLAMFDGDRTNSATSGQDRSSPSRPKHQKHADHTSDLRSETGQATATTATSPPSSPQHSCPQSDSMEILEEVSTPPVRHPALFAFHLQKPNPADNQAAADTHCPSASRRSVPGSFGIAAESGASRDTETVLYVRSNTAGLQRGCYGQNADARIVNDSDDDDVLILTPSGSGIDVWISARNRSTNDEDDAGSM